MAQKTHLQGKEISMSKNKSDQYQDAEEYLTQVEWQNQQSNRRIPLPWYMVPKWRYKRSSSSTTQKAGALLPVIVLFTILFAAFAASAYLLAKDNFGLCIVPLVIGGIIFLAIRDATKRSRADE